MFGLYLSEVIDGTGLGTDVLPVLLELLVPWFCCSDCICSAAEYNVDSFLEHTWPRLLASVWDKTTWSTYCNKNGHSNHQQISGTHRCIIINLQPRQNVLVASDFAAYTWLFVTSFLLDLSGSLPADKVTWNLLPYTHATNCMLPTATKHFQLAGLNSCKPH